MSRSSHTHHLWSLLLGLALLPLAPQALATHSWGGYHWAWSGNYPFTLQLGDNMSGGWTNYNDNNNNWKTYLGAASYNWNHPSSGSTPLITAIRPGLSTKRSCSMVRGTTQVCNGSYGNNGWLGLASINISGLHITQGTAKMNDSYFNLSKYNNPNEKLHVICQEVAHTFGLGHQDETGISLNTCMDYFSNTGANAGNTDSTKPNAHDFEELNIIYITGHNSPSTKDTSSTVAASAVPTLSNGVDIDDNPNSWGKLMSQSANGRSSYYERSNHDNSRTLTHVYWTEESASRCPQCDHRFEQH